MRFRVAAACALLATALAAQKFDVVSIKPIAAGSPWQFDPNAPNAIQRGAYRNHHVTVLQLVMAAYPEAINNVTLVGLPPWTWSEYFAVAAVASGPPPESAATSTQSVRRMLQTMLADRLAFKFHREARQMKLLTLVTDDSGKKLHPSDPSSDPPHLLVGIGAQGIIRAHSTTMAELAARLQFAMREPIVDATGLQGAFTFNLDTDAQGYEDERDPFFFELKRQLGLELKSGRGSVSVMVVDHVAPPTAN